MTAERVNVPMYEQLLLTEWLAGHPELVAALSGGIDVAEVGTRRRDRAPDPRRRVPGSRFTGFDIDAPTVDEANEAAAAAGLGNLRFEVVDGGSLPVGGFDLVCVFDALHHMTEPGAVLDGIRAALRPGGSLLIAEAALTGDAAADAADPTAAIVYGSDLIYCFQESKTPGRPGLGATWPGRGLDELAAEHGFREAGSVESQAGYVVIRLVAAAA